MLRTEGREARVTSSFVSGAKHKFKMRRVFGINSDA